ncbi:F-box/LRR-repeat protein 7 [Drosophila novamexicana]|uniref:F-box/LRR-repeat protein 7 n=1 Tax=Drosophila novamexicana TaxID=47314 RepID=UPI0011E5AEC0|nr:F-box/LRR-repeat protein 7 [Drosophila novamexicana]
MSHKTSARRATDLECPLASLGRTSNGVRDQLAAAHYHHPHPLSSSPLDPQAYKMSRKSPNLGHNVNDTVANGELYPLASRSSTPHSDQQTPSSTATTAAVLHMVQQKAATFELRGRHTRHDQSSYGAHSTASVGRHAQAKKSPELQTMPAPATRTNAPVPQPRNFLTLDWLHGNSADTEDSSDNNAGGAASAGRRRGQGQGGRCSVPTVLGNGNSAQYLLDKKMESLYLGNALRALPLGAEASQYQNERYYLEDYSSGSGNERLPERLHHPRNSSPSETSGSDRYLLNRSTNSPANAFQLDHHHTKVQSLSDGLCNMGRFSPSLDQGYATLVSPSPTGHHPSSTGGIVVCSNPKNSSPSVVSGGVITSSTPATTPRRGLTSSSSGTVNGTAIGPPPWNRKGPYRCGPYFDRLPDEAVVRIFSWLDSCELCNVARVCRRFEQLAWRPVLWKCITLRGEHLNGDKTLKMIFRQLCGQSCNGACPEVERVMLAEGCRISDKGLQLLTRRCPELTHLQLQTCEGVSNQALVEALTKCSNLQHLDVTGCSQVSSISPNPHMEPPRRLLLQYLDLTDCMAIDDMGLKIVVKNCPQLVYLYLRRCIQITDAGLKFVPSFCVSLKELSVSDCVNITDFGLYELAKLGAALRYLSVAKCERVSDAGLKVIARRCYKLRYLNARGCEAVSDDSITVLARSCPRLRALDIGKCDVSDAGLRALAESCPNLKKLSLRNCDMITDRGVQCIAYYCRGLQQLNIQDCQISIEGYRAVKKYCKRCIIEHTNPGFC